MNKSIKDVINSLPTESAPPADPDFMSDDKYASAAQEVIDEALKDGFDVLYMENGDIITTGTKVIVTQYRWEPEKNKMVKISSKQKD